MGGSGVFPALLLVWGVCERGRGGWAGTHCTCVGRRLAFRDTLTGIWWSVGEEMGSGSVVDDGDDWVLELLVYEAFSY